MLLSFQRKKMNFPLPSNVHNCFVVKNTINVILAVNILNDYINVGKIYTVVGSFPCDKSRQLVFVLFISINTRLT